MTEMTFASPGEKVAKAIESALRATFGDQLAAFQVRGSQGFPILGDKAHCGVLDFSLTLKLKYVVAEVPADAPVEVPARE